VFTERYDLARWKTAEDTLSYFMARGPFNGLAYGIACSFLRDSHLPTGHCWRGGEMECGAGCRWSGGRRWSAVGETSPASFCSGKQRIAQANSSISATDVPCYWDIPDVESARCKEAKQMRERGETVPPALALAVTKHYFKERMGLPQFTWTTPTDPAIPKHVKEALDYMPKWTEDKELVDALWRGRGPCAEDCQERHHKPTCVEDCSVSHKHLRSGFKGGFIKHRDQFKLIALNKMSSHEATLSACVGLDYAEGGCTSLSLHSYGAKAIVIHKVCGVLGIPHPGVQHVWSREQWWAIVKEMKRVQEWEDLPEDHMLRTSSLEDRALTVFEMR
jgi:hypothetical protein